MFENMSEDQAKIQILEMVKEYYSQYQNKPQTFHPGDSIRYESFG